MNRVILNRLLVSLAVIFFSFVGQAKTRALLVVSELDFRGAPELASIYLPLEVLTWKIPSQSIVINNLYQNMFYLRNERARVQEINQKLIELIRNKSVDVIDMIVAVHGSPGALSFYDQTIKVKDWTAQFKDQLERELGSTDSSKLGFLYNLSCYGSTHIDAFLAMGFETVVGSRKVNANAEMEYPWVLQSLALGNSVASAFYVPNSKVWLKMADGPVRWLGRSQNNFLKETDSYKMIGGNRNLRINRIQTNWKQKF